MDIRFINGRNEIINASKLSIKVMGNFLIGIDAGKNVVEIERYENTERAKEVLEGIASIISGELYQETRGIVIDLREEEGDKK